MCYIKELKERKFQKKYVVMVAALCFCLFIFLMLQGSFEQNRIIDLNGNNEDWKASLNISTNYNSELIIQPRRDDFPIPDKITANIIEDEEIIYSVDLQYLPHKSNSRLLGRYVVYFDSSDCFKHAHNIEEVVLNITYNENDISIVLERNRWKTIIEAAKIISGMAQSTDNELVECFNKHMSIKKSEKSSKSTFFAWMKRLDF